MSNYFLKVDKALFKMGLTPIEILLIAQISEFQHNTGDCFISDKVLAENFGVSESTITRTLKALETKGYITRETKSTNSGKTRHIKVNMEQLEEDSATSKMTVDKGGASVKMSLAQQSNCCLRNKQNDLIKDNIKDKEIKDNNGVDKIASLRSAIIINSQDSQKEQPVEKQQPQVMTTKEAMARYGVSACANRVAASIANCYWIEGELVKLV